MDNELIELAAGWTADPAHSPWLDFGEDVHSLTPLTLRAMCLRPVHCLRIFTAGDETETPAGLVAFSNIAPESRTAMVWYVLGDKRFARQGLTSRAVGALLAHGFGELGLESAWAWVATGNPASERVLERHGFRRIGIQRRCHRLGDRTVDRTLFDLLQEEFASQ
ncbi:GNAT family N-acetyltransferase [Thioalkalivibrio sp. XN8]|nr:GNAT family N-acetyltransferase [Thioalkalivibrio sp. XN8]